jgi:hypothetical protein
MIAIVAVHAGKWVPNGSVAEAVARGIDMPCSEMQEMIANKGDHFWDQVARALGRLAVAHGGMQLDGEGKIDWDRSAHQFTALYEEIPEKLKRQLKLWPTIGDYFL